MSADFLTTLAARTLGLTPVIQPVVASLFAPQTSIGSDYSPALDYGVESSEAETIQNSTFKIENESISSSLVPSGNSSGTISRLPYSQILAAVPDIELGKQEQVNRSLSSLTNSQPVTENISASASPVKPIPETAVISVQTLTNQPNSGQESDNKRQFSNQKIEHPIHSEPDKPNEILTSSQIVSSEINPVTPQLLSPNHPQLQTKENAIAALVEPLDSDVNLRLRIDNQNPLENTVPQFTVSNEQSNLIPSSGTQSIVQRQVDAATPLPSPSLASPSLSLERSESVTPVVEPLINQIDLQPQTPNQQHFGSQSQEFFHSNEQSNFRQQNIDAEIFTSGLEVSQSESTASPPFIVPANAVTPIVSPLENQQLLASQKQDNSGIATPTSTFESTPTVVPKNAVTPIVSPLENQQLLAFQKQDNSGIATPTPTFESTPTVVPKNAVTPIVSPLENQQLLASQRQDDSGTATPTSTFESTPTVVPKNAVTPIVSPLENQQLLASQKQDDSATPASTPTVVPKNAVTPIVSPLENQQLLASQRQDDSGTATPTPTFESTPTVVPKNAVTPIVSPLENQQLLASQRQDDSGTATPTPTFESTPTVVPKNAVTPVVSPLENQQPFVSPGQDNSATPATVGTPLVDKRILKSDNYSEAGEFSARLPSANYLHQNTAKVKPLIVMSQQRSLDFENDTQLASKRGLGKNGRETTSASPPTVQVTIGRIEVRSTPAPTTPTSNNKSTPRQPSVSLQDYLKQRQGGKP